MTGSISERAGPCAVVAALAVLAVASAGAVTASAAQLSVKRWSPLVCRQVAHGIAWNGLEVVLHYQAPLSNYQPDPYLEGVETGVPGYQRNGCRPAVLGRALVHRLTRRQRIVLLSHVPPAIARYLRHALAAV